eukprot:scaffold11935_cov167-Isochrysis_galbana.AAC.2
MHDDFERRWNTEMPPAQRVELDIATMLDPRFKTYKFPGLTSTTLDTEAECAELLLRSTWRMDWKPAAPDPAPAPAPAAPTEKPAAAKTVNPSAGGASAFFAIPLTPLATPSPWCPIGVVVVF